MNRRDFIKLSATTALIPLVGLSELPATQAVTIESAAYYIDPLTGLPTCSVREFTLSVMQVMKELDLKGDLPVGGDGEVYYLQL